MSACCLPSALPRASELTLDAILWSGSCVALTVWGTRLVLLCGDMTQDAEPIASLPHSTEELDKWTQVEVVSSASVCCP